jgi:hypothetical protein
MKYINDLINEAEETKTRFKESIELILCCETEDKLEETINVTVINKYSYLITYLKSLSKLLEDIKEYKTKKMLLELMTKSEK